MRSLNSFTKRVRSYKTSRIFFIFFYCNTKCTNFTGGDFVNERVMSCQCHDIIMRSEKIRQNSVGYSVIRSWRPLLSGSLFHHSWKGFFSWFVPCFSQYFHPVSSSALQNTDFFLYHYQISPDIIQYDLKKVWMKDTKKRIIDEQHSGDDSAYMPLCTSWKNENQLIILCNA